MNRFAVFALTATVFGSVDGFAADSPSKTPEDSLAKYQVDLSGGAVSASEVLGLTQSAVTTLQTPKDFTATLGALTSDGGKAAFGVAFTPGRTTFAPVSVSISDYVSNIGLRIWAGTTFSYAQNTRTEGAVDYRQQAFALQIAWYLNKEHDPFVAGYRAFSGCNPLKEIEQKRGATYTEVMEALKKEGVPLNELDEKTKARIEAQELEVKEETFLKNGPREAPRPI